MHVGPRTDLPRPATLRVLLAAVIATTGLTGCGAALRIEGTPGAGRTTRTGPAPRTAVTGPSAAAPGPATAAQDVEAARECRVLSSTLEQPPGQWTTGLFAIAAEGTPPTFGRAVTRMEIAVGDSYGPELSGPTLATIEAVADLCAARGISVPDIVP